MLVRKKQRMSIMMSSAHTVITYLYISNFLQILLLWWGVQTTLRGRSYHLLSVILGNTFWNYQWQSLPHAVEWQDGGRGAVDQVLVYKYRNKRSEEANSYQTPTACRALGNMLSHWLHSDPAWGIITPILQMSKPAVLRNIPGVTQLPSVLALKPVFLLQHPLTYSCLPVL